MAIIDPAAFPEFPRVCEEIHRGSKTCIEILRLGLRFCEVFGDQGFLGFELFQLGLHGAGGRRAVRLDHQVGSFADIGVDFQKLCLLRSAKGFHAANPALPDIAEHGCGYGDERSTWSQGTQKGFKGGVDLVALDALAAGVTAFLKAFIVGVALGPAFRPIPGHRMPAAVAGDVAAKREVFGFTFLMRRCGTGLQAGLDALEALPRNDRLELAFGEANPPRRIAVMARVNFVLEHVLDPLRMDVTLFIAAKHRVRLEETFHIRLAVEAARGEAFEGFLQKACRGLIADQNFAAALGLDVFVAHGRPEAEIPLLQPRPHSVLGLLGVLLAMMLRDGGQHVLDQLAVAVIAELDGRAFEPGAHGADGGAEL